jgi:ankyrin repeat protein
VAEIVTAVGAITAVVVMVNTGEAVAPAATVTEGGTVALGSLLEAAMLGQAARSPKTDSVQFLLDSGAGVNLRSRGQGWTPLLSAANDGSIENAKLLLNKGADANAKDNNGHTALWYAAILEHTG